MRAGRFGADATSLSARSGAHVAKINSTISQVLNEIAMSEQDKIQIRAEPPENLKTLVTINKLAAMPFACTTANKLTR